jgi:hypothetical protein
MKVFVNGISISSETKIRTTGKTGGIWEGLRLWLFPAQLTVQVVHIMGRLGFLVSALR